MLGAKRTNAKSKIKRKKKVFRKRVCKLCTDRVLAVDYKDVSRLQRFVTEKGKIIPKSISGNCSRCQRMITMAVKRARQIALLPYSAI